MMWAVMGIGMLINTIQANKMKGQFNQTFQANQQQMQRMEQNLKSGEAFRQGFMQSGPKLNMGFDRPTQAYQGLENLQNQNFQERQQVEGKMRQDFGKMKDDFFKKNHYETEFGNKGKGQVVTNEEGKPKVKAGPESPPQKTVRQHFESSKRLELANKHSAQADQFLKQETVKVKEFLAEHATHLTDPIVQGELSKLVVQGKKKSLKMQQEQDDERWRSDMPPTNEIQEAVEFGLRDLRDMENRHMESEENSPDHQAILDFEQEFAAAMSEEKSRIEAQKADEQFLMDPRKMMQMASASETPKQRFDQVLPGYLVENLFQMGIYEV